MGVCFAEGEENDGVLKKRARNREKRAEEKRIGK